MVFGKRLYRIRRLLPAWKRPSRPCGGPLPLVVLLGIWQAAALAPFSVLGQLQVEAKAAESPPAVEVRAATLEEAVDPGRPLWVISADGSGLRQLVTMPDFTAQGSPEFSSDAGKLAFDAWRPAQGEDYSDAHVFVANADGSSPRDLGPGAMPSLSPRGNRIVFSQYEPHGVWVMYADGSGRRQLDPEGWGGQWSPDGRMLAWTITEDGSGNIRIYDLIEGELRTVLEGDARRYQYIYQGFDWSPDGKRLAFKGVTFEGQEEIAIAHADGSSKGFKVRLKQKTGPNVAWSPDGKRMLIYKRCPERKTLQVYVLDADSEAPPELLEGQDPEKRNMDAEWSPDSTRIVFASGPRK